MAGKLVRLRNDVIEPRSKLGNIDIHFKAYTKFNFAYYCVFPSVLIYS